MGSALDALRALPSAGKDRYDPLHELAGFGETGDLSAIGAWEDVSPVLQRRRKPDGSYEYRANPSRFEGAPGVEGRGEDDKLALVEEAMSRTRSAPEPMGQEVVDQLKARVAQSVVTMPEAASMGATIVDKAMNRRPSPPGLSAPELMNPRTLYPDAARAVVERTLERRDDVASRLAEKMADAGYSPMQSALADTALEATATVALDPTNTFPAIGGAQGLRPRPTLAPDAVLRPETPLARQLPEDPALLSFPEAHPMLAGEAATAERYLGDLQSGTDRGPVNLPDPEPRYPLTERWEAKVRARGGPVAAEDLLFSRHIEDAGFDPGDLSRVDEAALRESFDASRRKPPDLRPDVEYDPKAKVFRVGDREFLQGWQADSFRENALDPATGGPRPELTRERWEQLRAGLSDATAGRYKATYDAIENPRPYQPLQGRSVAESYSALRQQVEARVNEVAALNPDMLPEQIEALRASQLKAFDIDQHAQLAEQARQSADPIVADLADQTEAALAQPFEAPGIGPGGRFKPSEAGHVTLGGPPPQPPRNLGSSVIRYGPDPKEPVRQRLQKLSDRWIDEMSNKEEAPVRMLKRAGLEREARTIEMYIGKRRGAARVAHNVISKGVRIWDPALQGSRRIYDSYESIVGGLTPEAWVDVNNYAAARHHMELESRKLAAGPDDSDARLNISPEGTRIAQEIIHDVEARYGSIIDPLTGEKRVARLDDLLDNLLGWSNASVIEQLDSVGFFSPDRKAALLDRSGKAGKYAPFHRLLDDLADNPVLSGGSTSNPIKRLSGGLDPERPIAPPLEAWVAHAQRIAMWVEKQRVRNLLGDFAEAHPAELPEIKRVSAANAPDAFQVFRDGQRILYSAPEDVLGAVDKLQPQQVGYFTQMAVAASRMLRAGATLLPDFALRNFLRDQATAGVYGSEFRYRPFGDFATGLWAQTPWASPELKDFVERWESAGGALSDYINLERPQVQLSAHAAAGLVRLPGGKLVRAPRVAKVAADWQAERNVFVKYVMYPVIKPMEIVGGAIEQGTRIGAFRRASLRGASDLEAANFSRNITLDFGRSGSAAQRWNSWEAFANANLQDVARFSRAMRERPLPTILSAGAYVTIPAMAVYWAHKDDPAYQSLPEYEKAGFLQIEKIDDSRWARIPRPQGLINLVFGYGIQKALEAATEQLGPHPVEELLSVLFNETPLRYSPIQPDPQKGGSQGSLEFLPTIAQPAAEVVAPEGWSSYRDGPVVPRGMGSGEMLPEERALDYTSGAARWIGQKTGTAPLKVDYLIRGYGAGMATQLLRLGEMAHDELTGAPATGLPELPKTARDIPGLGGLVSSPSYGFASKPVQDLRAFAESAMEAANSLDRADKEGRVFDRQRILREHPEVLLAKDLQKVKQQLSDLQKSRREFRTMPGLTPEKRADILFQMDQQASQIALGNMHWMTDWLRGYREAQREDDGPGERKNFRTPVPRDYPRTSDEVDAKGIPPLRRPTLADIARAAARGERRYQNAYPGGVETELQAKNRREIGETAKIWQETLRKRGIEQPNGELLGLGEYFLGTEIARQGINESPDTAIERLGVSGRRGIKEKGPGLGKALAGDNLALAKIRRTILDSFTTESTDKMTEILTKAQELYGGGLRGRQFWDTIGALLDDKSAFGE